MKTKKVNLLLIVASVICLSLLAGPAGATPIDQYADSVIGFSSQYTPSSWAAYQALGTPNTTTYFDNPTAWAPLPENGSHEYITLGFTTPVYATGVTIRETWGNGFVYQVDVMDTGNVLHPVWAGTDTSSPGSPVDFPVTWATTNYLVTGVKIYTDTNHNLNAWEEIDSVQLHGDTTAPVPLPPSVLLLGSGLLGLGGLAWRRRRN